MPTDHRLEAIENLKEAARYVKTNVVEAKYHLRIAISGILMIASPKCDRLIANLNVAELYIQVEPDVAISYLLGASFELQCIKENE